MNKEGERTHYRCDACGNLTRFDVTRTQTKKAFHHYSISGELQIEGEETLSETIDAISCRWCGHGRAVTKLVAENSAPNPE